jgi:hypothetical protein
VFGEGAGGGVRGRRGVPRELQADRIDGLVIGTMVAAVAVVAAEAGMMATPRPRAAS